MKRIGSKGFGAVEAILILLIIGIIAGLGWYVYDHNQKSNETADAKKQTQQEITDENTERPLAFDPSGDIVKQNQIETLQKLTYTAPVGWQKNVHTDNEYQSYYSPDFKGIEYPNGSSVTGGGEFSVSAYPTEYTTIRQMAEDDGITYFTVNQYTQVGGVPAVEGTCGHFGQAVCFGIVHKGYYYEVSYRQVDENAKGTKTPDNKYEKEFASFVNSFKFN